MTTSISTLIDFLMSLMRDEDTKRSFERDPDGTMADKGLQDVSAQDVRDARLIMADSGDARPRQDGGGSHANGYHESGISAGAGSNSAVREILHTTNTFEIDQSKTILNIDASRTNILDSFNSQDKVIAIQDNDTVIDIDEDDEEDKTDDKTDDEAEDKTGDEPEDKEEEPGEPKDGDEQEPPTDRDPDLPSDPGPPADDVPGVPMPEGDPNAPIDPGDGTGDGSDPFPTEPEPLPDEEPVMAEADDDLPVA